MRCFLLRVRGGGFFVLLWLRERLYFAVRARCFLLLWVQGALLGWVFCCEYRGAPLFGTRSKKPSAKRHSATTANPCTRGKNKYARTRGKNKMRPTAAKKNKTCLHTRGKKESAPHTRSKHAPTTKKNTQLKAASLLCC